MKNGDGEEKRKSIHQVIGYWSAVGMTFTGCAVGGYVLGAAVDRGFGWTPWASIFGSVIGLVSGIWSILRFTGMNK